MNELQIAFALYNAGFPQLEQGLFMGAEPQGHMRGLPSFYDPSDDELKALCAGHLDEIFGIVTHQELAELWIKLN